MIPDMDMHETLPKKSTRAVLLVTSPEKLPKQIVSGCLWRFHANLEAVSNKREDGSTTVKYVSKKCDSQRGNMLATVSQGNVRVCDISSQNAFHSVPNAGDIQGGKPQNATC